MNQFRHHQKPLRVRVVYPASKGEGLGRDRQDVERKHGFDVNLSEILMDRSVEPLCNIRSASSSVNARVGELLEAIHDTDADAILCGRGGYGASDLLEKLPWAQLKQLPPRVIVGFSDISALHSAFWTKLNWPCIHGPMIDTPYWIKSDGDDINQLKRLILRESSKGYLNLQNCSIPENKTIKGWLFGGCLSVLTNLIGTPYFPRSLAGSILFFEDINEPVGRILRNINQWIQAGQLLGVKAIVLGRFFYDDPSQQLEDALSKEIADRCQLPVFRSPDFGHCTPNLPIIIGADGRVDKNTLHWEWRIQEHATS